MSILHVNLRPGVDHCDSRSSQGARGLPGQGYLSPRLEGCSSPLATLWYDWFLPETAPDHSQVSQLERLFQQAGGVKCWTGDRLVSPLGEKMAELQSSPL